MQKGWAAQAGMAPRKRDAARQHPAPAPRRRTWHPAPAPRTRRPDGGNGTIVCDGRQSWFCFLFLFLLLLLALQFATPLFYVWLCFFFFSVHPLFILFSPFFMIFFCLTPLFLFFMLLSFCYFELLNEFIWYWVLGYCGNSRNIFSLFECNPLFF